MKNKNIKKIILILISLILVSIISLIIYDRITINNQYNIEEANLEIPVFVYHDIVNNESEIEYDYMQTTKERFEEQIKGLQDYGYHFITYDELQKYKNHEIKLSKKSCLLTFDDGFKGVYENAFPIAKKYNIPFTIFIIINNMDTPGYLTWNQTEEMDKSGIVTVASHSMNHDDFSLKDVENAVNDVEQTYNVIEEKLGKQKQKIFTYPYGLYTEEEIVELEKRGYIQNLTDNKINKSKNIDMARLHRSYPLGDSSLKVLMKVFYRSIKYN